MNFWLKYSKWSHSNFVIELNFTFSLHTHRISLTVFGSKWKKTWFDKQKQIFQLFLFTIEFYWFQFSFDLTIRHLKLPAHSLRMAAILPRLNSPGIVGVCGRSIVTSPECSLLCGDGSCTSPFTLLWGCDGRLWGEWFPWGEAGLWFDGCSRSELDELNAPDICTLVCEGFRLDTLFELEVELVPDEEGLFGCFSGSSEIWESGIPNLFAQYFLYLIKFWCSEQPFLLGCIILWAIFFNSAKAWPSLLVK